jgi:acetolactate synthase-1/2/3 large subunit
MTVSDYIFKFLAAQNVGHVFMLSGGGCMHLCNSLGKSGIGYTCCLNEQAVTIAALGYAQYVNDMGAALVTSGPGATNAITGVMAAWTESVPLLVLSGQVKTSDSAKLAGVRVRGVQEAPTVDIVRPITKYAVTVTNPEDIRYHLEKAFFRAKDKRPGPVWLDIPLDIQSAAVDEDSLRSFEPPAAERDGGNFSPVEILRMIGAAERPVLLAGYGVRVSRSVKEFRELAKKLSIPVLTTWKAADIMPESHPLFIGRPGIAGQRGANFTQQNADLILIIGARLDFPQTGFNQDLFAREAKKIIVDVDPAELKKFGFAVDIPLCLCAKDFITALNSAAVPLELKDEWLTQCRVWKETYPPVPADHYEKKGFASLYVLTEAITDALGPKDLIVPGSSGMGSDVSYQTAKIKEGQRMLNSPGLGSMGFGIPSALGACIASGGRRTICVNGDGGFQMNIQELETIKSRNLPVKFFVLNNRGYGSIRNTQRNYFDGFYVGSSPESGVSLPDVLSVGRAYGYDVFSIRDNTEIHETVRKVLESGGPAICEVKLDPGEGLSFRASSFIRPDGTAVSRPVEDLYPFLPRKEFYHNMYVKPLNKTGVNLCNILFDLDGTIIDSRNGITVSMKYALMESGLAGNITGDEAIARTIGLPLSGMIKELLPGADEAERDEVFRLYRQHYAEKGVYDCSLYGNIEKVLEKLSKEFDLFIVTSKSADMAKKALSHLNIARYFIEIKGVELSPPVKNKSTLIKELVLERGLDPEKTLMVGDRREDILAAAENNIKTIGVSYGYGFREELQAAMLVAESADELTEIFL